MKRKRIVTILLTAMMVLSLAACSSRKEPAQNSSNTEPPQNAIEIIDKKMEMKGKSVSVPQVTGRDEKDLKIINQKIFEKIEEHIDRKSNLYDFNYIVKHNDGRYVSIIIVMLQYKRTMPHPGAQAYAINLDIKEKTILDNNALLLNVKEFCQDIKYGKYILLPENEIPNNIAYPSGYIENKRNRRDV